MTDRSESEVLEEGRERRTKGVRKRKEGDCFWNWDKTKNLWGYKGPFLKHKMNLEQMKRIPKLRVNYKDRRDKINVVSNTLMNVFLLLCYYYFFFFFSFSTVVSSSLSWPFPSSSLVFFFFF